MLETIKAVILICGMVFDDGSQASRDDIEDCKLEMVACVVEGKKKCLHPRGSVVKKIQKRRDATNAHWYKLKYPLEGVKND